MSSQTDLKQHNRRSFLKVAGTAGTAALAGCSGASNETGSGNKGRSEDETSERSTSSPPSTSGGSLTAGTLANKLATLDPAMIDVQKEIQIASNIYNALLRYDEKMNIVGDVATDWKWTSDTTVEFTLEEGVTFHNGSKLTAKDVKFSLERVLDKDTGSPWRGKLKTISAIEVKNAQTVVLELEKPYAPLASYLTRRNMGGCIVPKDATKSKDLSSNPIGSGPFEVDKWEKGSEIILEKFDDYWKKGEPHLDSVTVKMIPSSTTLTTALEAGDVGIINTVPHQALPRLKQKQEINLYSSEGMNVRYIGFNTRAGNVFSDPKVRQAASLALSRENIIRVLGPKVYNINRSPVPKALEWAHTSDVPMQSQNTKRAKQLLEEAGAKGEKISIKVWKEQSWKNIATTARDMLNEVGFDAEVKVFEWGTFWNQVTANANFDAFVLGWTGLTDPDGYLYSQFHTGGSWNWMGYSNENVDKLLEKGRTEYDRKKRAEYYHEAQKIVSEDAVYANVATQKIFQASRERVNGYKLLPTGSFRFADVSVSK